MRKTTFVLPLAAAAWLAATGCAPADRSEEVHTAGFISSAQLDAGVAGADTQGTQGIVTRRVWAGTIEPGGSPSPDGRYVSFVDWSTGDMGIRDLSTGEERRITDEGSWDKPEFAMVSRMSPDGRLVAYNWFEPGGTARSGWGASLRVVSAEGGDSRVLISKEDFTYTQPYGWSPDGSSVLVWLNASDNTNRIGLVAVADGELHIVKSLGWAQPSNMAVSADGRYVAYDVQRQESSPEHTVRIVATDGSGDRELTGRGGHNIVLGWEPSGRYLLYYGDHSGSPSVWALRLTDGQPQGEPVLIRSDIWHLVPMGFTAAGDLFYVVSTGKVDVFTVMTDPETGAPIGLPHSATPSLQAGEAWDPTWSPDGRHLAYRRMPTLGGVPGRTLVIRATESGEFHEIDLAVDDVKTPDWSSDGRFLLVQGEGQGQLGIYRIDVQTGEQGFAHTVEGDMDGAAWLDNGRTVVYQQAGDWPGPDQWCRFVTVDLSSGREGEVYRSRSCAEWWTLSPDRRTIAGTFPGDDGWHRHLRLISLSDGGARELARFIPNAEGMRYPLFSIPYWTPDGRAVHIRGCDSPDQLLEALKRCPNWSFDVETGQRRRLADEAPIGSIHPDGRRVAFVDGETSYEIWVMENYLPGETSEPGT